MDDAAYEALMARLNEAYPSQPAYTPADVKLQSGQITQQQGQDPIILTNPRTLQQGESNPIEFDQSGGVSQLGAMMNAGRLRGMLDMSAQDGMTPGYNAMGTMQLPEGYSASYHRSNEIGGLGDAQNAIMLAKQFGEPNTPSPSLSAGASRSGMSGPITYDLSGSVPLTTGRNPEAPQFRLPSSREEQPMVPLSRRDLERQPSHQEVRGAATAGLSYSPRDHSTRANAGLKFNYADGGHVDAALHLLRQHFDEGGFLSSLSNLFSGPDYLSTGEVASPTNWGDPESATDFFKADKAMRLAREVQAKDDVTGSTPTSAPLTAPRPGAVEVQELPVNIPFAAPERGASLLSSDISPASVTSLPLAYTATPIAAPTAAAIDQATGKLTARAPQDVEQPATNAQILAAIRANESRNNPRAQNPSSSAGGLYQFINSTWGNTLRRMDPEQYGGYSDRQLRGLKTDPNAVDVQHAAANYHLTNDIAPVLSRAGVPLTPGSAYLSWFQGPGGAVKAYTAPDDATVAQVFPRTVSANANMRFNGKPYAQWTMSDLRQWADTAMAKRMGRAEGGLVDDALHVVREHHADGEAVGMNQRMRDTIASIDPERSQDQPVMDPATMGEAVGQAPEMPAEDPRPLTIYRGNRPKAVELPAETDADRVRAYKEMAAQVAQQSPEIQSMTHLGAKPTLPVTLDSGYAKGMELGRAPFDVAPGMSTLANTAYGAKSIPFYMNPVTAIPAAASDFTESAMDKSLPGMAMSLLGVPGKIAKYGAGALMGAAGMEPGEAQAAKLPRVGGAVASIAHAAPKAADMSIEQALEIAKKYSGYQDPAANKIADWNWRPLPDVATELNMTQIPPHVQAFGDYMGDMANKAGGQGLSARDMLKGYTTTRASIQRRATDADNLRRLGLDLPSDVQTIRPEGAWMEWLGTPMGQRFLDEAAKGNISEDTIANAVKIMAPFGRHETDIPDSMRWAAKNIPGREVAASDLVYRAAQGASTPEEWRNFTSDIRGVGPSKSGFLASLYGRGDQPTLDARQIILNTGEPTKLAAPFIARSKGEGGVEAVNRLAARQAALGLEAPSKYDPFYQHLAHHAIWDKASNEMTTHGDIIKGMRNYAEGGEVEAQQDPMGNVTVPAAGAPPDAAPSDEPGLVDRAMQFVSQFNPVGSAEAADLSKLRAFLPKNVSAAERAANLAKFRAGNIEDVPSVVYHGTGNDIHQFDTTKGAWFTDTPSLASEYANKPGGNVVPAHIALKNPIEFVHAEQRKPIGEVISTALSGARDLSAEQIGAAKPIVDVLRERYGKDARPLFEYWNNDPDVTKLFKTLGYDGISAFEKADRKAKTWSIFSPEQAKSAIGNAGTFDPTKVRLNEAKGGSVEDRALMLVSRQA